MIELIGKLVYDPHRQDFRKTHKQRTLIVQLPKDQLDLYYQWFILKEYGTWLTLQRPMFGLHCTVVKGDEHIPKDKLHLWKKYANEPVEIFYDPEELERHWQFWSLTVEAPRLREIRKELGLKEDFRLHLTVGRQYDWQPKVKVREQYKYDID